MLEHAGRYKILAELGRGGFGKVYRAFDPTLNSIVAIKELLVANDASLLVRFRNEAAAARRLQHPNIVTIYDYGEQDGVPFIVMELLDGKDLKGVIANRQPIPLWHKIQIMNQIAAGLAHAHANGIVHRDVKPANIMLLPNGNVKIMDFGIALISKDTENRVTPPGSILATVSYMAPELARGVTADKRADIWAFGVVFYELLAGANPFDAPTIAAVIHKILNEEPAPIRQVCPESPEQVQSVITRLLQKDPDLRYQLLEDFLFDCEPILLPLMRGRAHDLFEDAKLACENNQLKAAHSLLRRAIELDPSHPGARELREHLQAALQREAVRPRIEALTAEAHEQLAMGNPAEAVEKFEVAARLAPSDVDLKSSLERAKAALEQSHKVGRLVADAEQALHQEDLSGAYRIAQQAVDLAPKHPGVRQIFAKTSAALIEQERQRRFREQVAKARRLIEIRAWDEASSILDGLDLEPEPDEICVLRRVIEEGRRADARQHRLAAELEAAREEIRGRGFEMARNRLAALHAEFPEMTDVGHLLDYVISEIEAQRRNELVDRNISAARALVERNRFDDAARLLQSALLSYPADPGLERELQAVFTAQRRVERDIALRHALEKAKELRIQGRFEEALVLLEAFTAQHNREAAVEDLREVIERDRENARRAAELREMVDRINNLLSQGNAEEVMRLLQEAPSSVKDFPEIARLRRLAETRLLQAERTTALDEAILSANGLRQHNDFEKATQILTAVTMRYGPDPRVIELEQLIQRERQEVERPAAAETRETVSAPVLSGGARSPVTHRSVWKPIVAFAVATAILILAVRSISHRRRLPVATAIEVGSDPPGASVSLGDNSCITPACRFELKTGSYQVQARLDGYQTAQRTIRIGSDGSPGRVDFVLEPLPPPTPPGGGRTSSTGTLIVNAAVPDALVFVDNVPSGRTDQTGTCRLLLEARTHRLRIEKAGYKTPPEQQVGLTSGGSKLVSLTLSPLAISIDEFSAVPTAIEPGEPVTLRWKVINASSVVIDQLGPVEPSGSRAVSPTADTVYKLTASRGNAIHEATVTVKVHELKHEKSSADQSAWDSINKTDPAALQSFARQYPSSPHTPEAMNTAARILKANQLETDRQAIARALTALSAAVERKDEAALRAIWPRIPARTLDQWKSDFQNARSIQLEFHLKTPPEVDGNIARVECHEVKRIVFDRDSQIYSNEATARLTLYKNGSEWFIDTLR